MSQTFVIQPDRAQVAGLARWLAAALPGKALRVEVAEYRKRRSDQQNRYLWGVAYKRLEEATGQEAADWHDFFLGEFFGWERVSLFDRPRLKPLRRSKKLSTTEFSDYVEFIQRKAAEHGIYIPSPNEEIA